MDNRNEMKPLDDEQLDQVSGGGMVNRYLKICPKCREEFDLRNISVLKFTEHIRTCKGKNQLGKPSGTYERNGMKA